MKTTNGAGPRRGDGGAGAETHSTGLRRLLRAFTAVAILWLNLCLLFIAANVIAYVALALWPPADNAPAVAAHIGGALKQVFPDFSDEQFLTLMRENAREFVYEPFTQFREKPSSGRYVNVDANGFRRSREQGPWPPDPANYNVFMFGGSTTFGIGVPDDQTVASHLQEALAEARPDGRAVRIYNFGRGAYYSSQERALFERLIVAGYIPDLAVFMDGLNDFFFHEGDRPALTPVLEQLMEQTVPGPVGGGVALRSDKRQLAYSTLINALPVVQLLARWRVTAAPRNVMLWRGDEAKGSKPDEAAAIDAVIRRYEANRLLIEAAAAAVGVRVVFVWQPVPLYKYDLRYHLHQDKFGRYEILREGYPKMAERVRTSPQPDNFIWCADIQEELRELLYVDQVHYSPAMSARIARCIADQGRARGLLD